MVEIEQLPSKASFSKRFEEIVGEAGESAAASRVARRFHVPETTVCAIDIYWALRRSHWRPRLVIQRRPAIIAPTNAPTKMQPQTNACPVLVSSIFGMLARRVGSV